MSKRDYRKAKKSLATIERDIARIVGKKPCSIVDRFLAGEWWCDLAEDIAQRDGIDFGPASVKVDTAIRRALKKARKEAAELRAIAVTPAAKRWRQIAGRGKK